MKQNNVLYHSENGHDVEVNLEVIAKGADDISCYTSEQARSKCSLVKFHKAICNPFVFK